jgi:WD40 repeat protein
MDLDQLQRETILAERRAKHRTRIIVAGIAAAAVIAMYLWSAIALHERQTAEQQRMEADLQRQQADLQRERAQQVAGVVTSTPDRALYLSKAGYLVNAQTGNPISKIFGGDITSARFSPDGKRLVIASNQEIQIFDAQGILKSQFSLRDQGVQTIRFSPDSAHIMAILTDGSVELFDLGGQPITRFAGSKGITNAVFSPDGRLILTQSMGPQLQVWDISTGRLLVSVDGPDSPINLIGFNDNGHQFIAGASSGTVVVWDITTGQVAAQFTAYVP